HGADEAIITLSGGAPWGFRLQGGVEHQKALQVAKVRKRSKACRAGLREADELVFINEQPCGTLSHAQAMDLIDGSPGLLHIRVRRSEELKVPVGFHHSSATSGLTSPPGSEAYYGETDSDADVAGYERQRRQKRRSPSNSTPGKPAEEDSAFLEPSNVPLVSPERAKEARMLSSRSQLVPMVGPLNKPIDEELSTTYMEKAKQAKLNRGDTVQDKNVKEAKSKCRTIASLLTDAPNPHSKGVLMFKKRRQRSKKYTLTSFGSVDEDRCQDSQEEDGVFPGSESEFDEDGFSAVPDPTWDSDCLDRLEKRATAGTEGRGDGAEDAPSPGLSNTTGKGAQLFEQQRKRAAEQPHLQPQQMIPPAYGMSNGDISYSAVSSSMMMSTPPVAPKPATASVTVPTRPAPPAETPSNVLNRTARPFTPGFISLRAATAPVMFKPPLPPSTPSVSSIPFFVPQGPFAQTPEPTFYSPAVSTSVEKMQSFPQMTSGYQASFVAMPQVSVAPQAPMALAPAFAVSQMYGSPELFAPAPPLQVPVAQSHPPQFFMAPVATLSVVSQPEAVAPTPVPGPTGRTGILNDARRRGGKPKPMFNVPEVKKNSPNPDLLCMVQNLDDRSTRHKYGQPPSEDIYDDVEEQRSFEAGMGRAPPPVAPKPRVIHETPPFLQAGGKGAQLFARRQSRMGTYVVDTPLQTPYQQEVASHSAATVLDSSPNPSFPSQWKYSPNVRAPPPIGYNPLLAPSIPTGPQRNIGKPDSRGRGGSQREGIQALDFMRRQPYQLNSAMFNYGERLYDSGMISPPFPALPPSQPAGLPGLPKFSFQSAPELSILASLPPLKPDPVQAPKPHFVATKGGVQPRVWRPGAM
uniref:Synaptopodin 2-like protein n=1 Tax=Cyclopterus lumpus TaxID=8103 RepID=A0A8C3AV71_CYCLU